MGRPEPQWRKALRERLARQAEPTKNTEAKRNPASGQHADPWTLIACRNLYALMADKRDPIEAVLHEQLHAVTVRKGAKTFVLTATKNGWRSHPLHLDLEQPLDMTVRLAKRLRALLDEDTEKDSRRTGPPTLHRKVRRDRPPPQEARGRPSPVPDPATPQAGPGTTRAAAGTPLHFPGRPRGTQEANGGSAQRVPADGGSA